MAFSLSGGFAGALGGGGTGSMFGPLGAGIGAGVGFLAGGLLQQDEPSYEMSQEQKDLMNYESQIASGAIESPEVKALRAQSNKNFAQISGAMQMNRGATQGAKSAYLAGLGAMNQAQTNESAVAANANAVLQAKRNMAAMLSGQQGLNIQQANNEANRKSQFLGSMTQLGAFGASQYLKNKNKVG